MLYIQIQINNMENENKSEWSEEFGDLVSAINKKRAETKRRRDSPFKDITIMPISMKIASQTIGMNLVSVQPLSAPSPSLIYMDFQYGESEEARLKREKFEKRQRVVDSLLGKTVEKTEDTILIASTDMASTDISENSSTIYKASAIDKKATVDKWSPIMGKLTSNAVKQKWINDYCNLFNGSSGLTI